MATAFSLFSFGSSVLLASLFFIRTWCNHDFQIPGYTLTDDDLLEKKHSVVSAEWSGLDKISRSKRQAAPGTTPLSMMIEDKNHKYYNSTYFVADTKHYIDLETEDSFTVIPHGKLSESHLTAAAVNLPFTFTFYGHNVTKAYITTGGFIYLGPFFHDLLSATQYVAPLMGNFDPSINDSSIIRYANNGTAFTVEWDGVHVQHNIQAGSFTFQTTLMKDGRIIFAYKHIPTSPLGIDGGNGHKVTVGLSDGFYIQKSTGSSSGIEYYLYRYHVVDLDQQLVRDKTAFVLTPLPTCNLLSQSCETCLGRKLANFDCGWCSALHTCSSGFDRNRPEWLDANCVDEKHTDLAHCSTAGLSAGAVVGITLAIAFTISIIGLILWVGYSYTHPMSPSGLLLIELRHFFKKDSTHNVSNEDRYAVTISGDMEAEASSAPENPPAVSEVSLPVPQVQDTPPAVDAANSLPVTANPSSPVQA